MTPTLTAIVLGIVEGLTEFLPVSSTGHLILSERILGFDRGKWEVFNIAIQPGAILAIVVLYWRTFVDVLHGLLRGDGPSIAFVRNILIAVLPAVVLGLIFKHQIDALLESALVVAWALLLGGIAILVAERLAKPREVGGVSAVSAGQSLKVGVMQCLAMIPGVSRSGATILGAMSLGIDRKTAAEFSFFLAVPTLTGATVLSLWKARHAITHDQFGLIAIGFVVSFVVAIAVVKAFLAIITRHGFAPFGWYRIFAGIVAIVLLR